MPDTLTAETFGQMPFAEVLRRYNALREACRAEGTPRVQQALDDWEPVADAALARPQRDQLAAFFMASLGAQENVQLPGEEFVPGLLDHDPEERARRRGRWAYLQADALLSMRVAA
jgi:hypothetical protein